MIQTHEGVVLVDTTARPVDIQACLRLASYTPEDICQILLTHSHSDHTSGIPLFDCPVLAHKITHQRIKRRGSKRSQAQLPTDTFEDQIKLQIGEVLIEMIHLGGHTPGSSIVWLPVERILFSGDLIFEGRYPFLQTSNVRKLVEALRYLLALDAKVIIPGHGVVCDNAEVRRQLDYIEATMQRVETHLEQGHTLEETNSDPGFPIYSELGYEKLHHWNIKVVYQQLKKLSK
jgi:glyoxylase-like metal-dependent hydrolase (beta-lactamase superfamily II)